MMLEIYKGDVIMIFLHKDEAGRYDTFDMHLSQTMEDVPEDEIVDVINAIAYTISLPDEPEIKHSKKSEQGRRHLRRVK